MRGGSEIINEPVVLLEGGYMTMDRRNMYEFVVTQNDMVPQNDANRVVINLRALLPLPPLPLPPPLPPIYLSENEYRQEFLPVVDSGANDQPHGMFRGLSGSWWSRGRAMLEAAPARAAPTRHAGGKHQRKRSAHKRSGKSGHKRSGHKPRRSTRRHRR